MQNKLKPQSSQVIQQLRTANIKCVMVTGNQNKSIPKGGSLRSCFSSKRPK